MTNKNQRIIHSVLDYCNYKLLTEKEYIKDCEKKKISPSIKAYHYLREIVYIINSFDEYEKQEKEAYNFYNQQLKGVIQISRTMKK